MTHLNLRACWVLKNGQPKEKDDIGMFRIQLMGLITLLSLSACDILQKQHVAELDCIKSQRLYFNDPDSVAFVANLGSRGGALAGESFWVRYKAKNGYG